MSTSAPQTPESHLAHSEMSTPAQMREDCRAAGHQLERAAPAAGSASPNLHQADHPREVSTPEIRVDTAVSRLAGALHLHLD